MGQRGERGGWESKKREVGTGKKRVEYREGVKVGGTEGEKKKEADQ